MIQNVLLKVVVSYRHALLYTWGIGFLD